MLNMVSTATTFIPSTDIVPLGNDYYATIWQDGLITCENPAGDEIGQETLPAAQAKELTAYLLNTEE
jgi:hypothetical protein